MTVSSASLADCPATLAAGGVEGYLRHSPSLDADCRHGTYGTKSPHQSLVARSTLCGYPWAHDFAYPIRPRGIRSSLRFYRPPANRGNQYGCGAHTIAPAQNRRRVLSRFHGDAGWAWHHELKFPRYLLRSAIQSHLPRTPSTPAMTPNMRIASGAFCFPAPMSSRNFGRRFIGKCSPVHFFWGSFDLAVTRFSGRRAPERPDADPITREAYSHEECSAGWWPGGETYTGINVPDPAFYSYAFPEPPGYQEYVVRACGGAIRP